MDLLDPFNETNILFVIGATGVGKTTLSKRLLRMLIDKPQDNCEPDPTKVAFIYISAPANGEKSLSWTSIYENILKKTDEILIEKKQHYKIENGIMTVHPRRYKNLPALRDALESMLENRQVKVLAIDEAYHLLRFGDLTAVMDTLKPIVELTNSTLSH